MRRAKWSGRPDLNRGPSAPKADALPSCATPRGLDASRDPMPPQRPPIDGPSSAFTRAAAREHVREDVPDGQMRILHLTDMVAGHHHADIDEIF